MQTLLQLNNWTLSKDDQAIAYLVIDCSDRSVNALSKQVMEELAQVLDHLDKDKPAGLIIRSGKSNGFIAGADIAEFSSISQPNEGQALIERGWNLFNRLSQVKYPTLALGPRRGRGPASAGGPR